jgi:hypothetical protein
VDELHGTLDQRPGYAGKKSEASGLIRRPRAGSYLTERRCQQTGIPISNQGLVERYVKRIIMREDKIEIALKASDIAGLNDAGGMIEIRRKHPRTTSFAKIETDQRELSNEPDARLVRALAQAHMWLRALVDGTYQSVEELAASIKSYPRAIRGGLRLAFLAPNITEAILVGRHPRLSNIAKIQSALPFSWDQQRASLNLKSVVKRPLWNILPCSLLRRIPLTEHQLIKSLRYLQ